MNVDIGINEVKLSNSNEFVIDFKIMIDIIMKKDNVVKIILFVIRFL